MVSFGGAIDVSTQNETSNVTLLEFEAEDEEFEDVFSGTDLDDDIFVPYQEFNTYSTASLFYNITACRVEYLRMVNKHIGTFLNSVRNYLNNYVQYTVSIRNQVFTDEPARAIKKAMSLLKDIYLTTIPNKDRFNVKRDPYYEDFLGKRLNQYKSEMLK